MGVDTIPCILVSENQIPLITGAYPTFTPQILALPRPPLLQDALNPELTLSVPIIRTSKLIRITAEEVILPTE